MVAEMVVGAVLTGLGAFMESRAAVVVGATMVIATLVVREYVLHRENYLALVVIVLVADIGGAVAELVN